MKLKNILLVVDNIEDSIAFYRDLFGLQVILDQDGNVILSEGLVLQDRKIWENFIGQKVTYGHGDAELYFEEADLEAFQKKLNNCEYEIEYVNTLMKHDWGQRVIRIYDLDHHIIEIGEPAEVWNKNRNNQTIQEK